VGLGDRGQRIVCMYTTAHARRRIVNGEVNTGTDDQNSKHAIIIADDDRCNNRIIASNNDSLSTQYDRFELYNDH